MEEITNRLTETQVRQRLIACTNAEIADELYNFGQMLVRQATEDIHRVDLKAASLAAYAGATITLLVSSSGIWLKFRSRWMDLLILASALFVFLAGIFSMRALFLRSFEWFGQREWLQDSCFLDMQKLKRYRILTMWGVLNSHRDAHKNKTNYLGKAQFLLLISTGLLLSALIIGLGTFYLSNYLRFAGR